jgi:hypothetical protein
MYGLASKLALLLAFLPWISFTAVLGWVAMVIFMELVAVQQ